MLAAAFLSFGLGFLYFIAAIPGSAAAGLPLPWAVFLAWLGYSAGAVLVALAGTPLRNWLTQRFRIPPRNPEKRLWRIWDRAGLPGLGLIAPITIGPQAAALLALSTGSPPFRVIVCISLGVLPWCALFAFFTHYGIRWSGLGG
jgi:hypothetical protein